MSGPDLLPQKLEPFLITFNRSSCLAKTLSAFYESPWRDEPFNVLDNCSTDDTAAVVRRFMAHWPTLRYHKNKFNIGGNGNILRAAELSDSEYLWIIGDDDRWQLENLSEIFPVINNSLADVIRLGWLVPEEARAKVANAIELQRAERFFFASVSLISSTIVRRSLVVSNLPSAYMNIGDAYPQWVPVMKAFESGGFKVFSAPKDIVVHVPSSEPGYFIGDFEWYANWYRCGRFLSDIRVRKRFIAECVAYMTRDRCRGAVCELLWLARIALNFKAIGGRQWPYLCTMLGYGDGQRVKIFVTLLVYALVPTSIARLVRRAYFRFKGVPPKPIIQNRGRL